MARSIFVTWLNGVPYDTRDSPFLSEMKLTAAEYQTHSLAIANSHYDKDAASEAKLRVLVDFCDSYSQWQPDGAGSGSSSSSSSGPSDAKDNVDSDDDEGGHLDSGPVDMDVGADDSAPPAAPSSSFGSSSAASFAASAPSSPLLEEIKKEPARRPAKAKARTSSSASKKKRASSDSDSSESESDSSSSDSDEQDEKDKKGHDADETEYLPDRIIAKKTVRWQDFYLIHWLGFTAAERTWEPAAYFDQYCTKQTHDYEQTRRPVRILAVKARPGGDSKSAQELFFEVQWRGRSETSVERESSVQEDFPDLVKEWQRREEERKSRKQKSPPEKTVEESNSVEPHLKRRRTSTGHV